MAGIDLGTLSAKITLDDTQATKELKDFQTAVKNTGQGLEDLGKRFLPASLAISGIGVASIKTASDVDEMMSKFNAVFTDLSGDALKWADDYARAIGRSKYEIREAISNQADLFIGMGFTNKKSLELSQTLTELAYNVASFNNVSDSHALDSVTKAMLGETEAAKSLGMVLTENIMMQSEYVKASGKKWSAMNLQERAYAYLYEMQRQSTNAIREENGVMGDARITAESFTNQLRAMKGNFYDLSVAIGNAILPKVEPLVRLFNKFLTVLTRFAESNPFIVSALTSIAGALAVIPPILILVGKTLKGMREFREEINLVTENIPIMIAGFNSFKDTVLLRLPGLLASVKWDFASLRLQASLLSSTFLTLASAKLGLFFSGLGTSIAGVMASFSPFLGIIGKVALGLGALALLPKITGKSFEELGEIVWNGVKNAFEYLVENTPKWIEAGKEMVKNLIKGIQENLPIILEKGKELLKALIEGIVNSIETLVALGKTILDGLIQGIIVGLPLLIEGGKKLLEGLILGITEGLPWLLNKASELVDQFSIWIENNLPTLISTGVDFIVKIIEGITLAIPFIVDIVVSIIDTFAKGIETYLPLIIDAGVNILINLIDGVLEALPRIIDTAVEIMNTLLDTLVEMLPELIDLGVEVLSNLIDGMIEAIPQLIDAITTLITELLNAIVTHLPEIIDAGIRILDSLIEGIMKVLPDIIEAGWKLVKTLAEAIWKNLPNIVDAGIKILESLVEGILKLISSLIRCGGTIVTTLVKALIQNLPKLLEAGVKLVKEVIKGVGSIGESLFEAGKSVVNGILKGIKSAWSSVTGWISDSLGKLNPFGGRSLNVQVDGNLTQGLPGVDGEVSTFANARSSMNPTHFGFASRSGLFNLTLPKVETPKQVVVEGGDAVKEYIINTVVNLEGHSIAKATARFMKEELEIMERRSNRLGGLVNG